MTPEIEKYKKKFPSVVSIDTSAGKNTSQKMKILADAILNWGNTRPAQAELNALELAAYTKRVFEKLELDVGGE